MENYLNYFTHTKYTPTYFYQQLEHCIPEGLERAHEQLLYVGKVAAPILSCHKPTNDILLKVTNAVQFTTSVKDLTKCKSLLSHESALKFWRTTLLSLSLAGTYFNFTLGLYITTIADISQNCVNIYQRKANSLLPLICNEILPMVASALYLAMIQTASLELALISLCVQVSMNLIQAYQSYISTNNETGRKNDLPMFASKLCMAVIRAKQAQNQYHVIQRRNALYKIEELQNLIRRIQNAKEVDNLYDHPLISLAQKIHDGKCSLEDINGEEFELGSYFSQMGKGCVKGMNICFRSTDEYTELEFKLNHVGRQKLNSIVKELEKTKELSELLSLNNLNFEDVKVKRSNDHDEYKTKTEIQFKGLGNIIIGTSPENYGSYNTVTIQLKQGSSLYDFHGALSLLDLQESLRQSSSRDIERMKLGQLFRLFNPRKAALLERDKFFFSSTISELEDKIVELDPSMQKHIKEDKDRLVFQETLKGMQRLHYQDLDKELYDLGARDISAIITTGWNDNEDTQYERLCNILKMGILSSELKQKAQIVSKGINVNMDYNGKNDSIFVQMGTKSMQSYNELIYTQYFPGAIRIKFNLKALNSVSYQYYNDHGGFRNILSKRGWGGRYPKDLYINRPNIHDFVENLVDNQSWDDWDLWTINNYYDHELMIKNTIGPDLIEGLVVSNKSCKKRALEYLENAGLIVLNEKGEKTVNNIAIEDFIQVGQSC